MPIRFRCQECNQLLSIARRKIGMAVECPKCFHAAIVPTQDELNPNPTAVIPELAAKPIAEKSASAPAKRPEKVAVARPEKSKPETKPRVASVFEDQNFDQWIGAEPKSKAKPAPARPVTAFDDDDEDESDVIQAIDEPSDEADLLDDPEEKPAASRSGALVATDPVKSAAELPTTPRPLSERYRTTDTDPTEKGRFSPLTLGVFALGITLGFFVGRWTASGSAPDVREAQVAVIEKATSAPGADAPANSMPDKAEVVVPEPLARLRGRIQCKKDGSTVPDTGACVILLATNRTPKRKIDPASLAPRDPKAEDRPGLAELKRYNASMTFVNDRGEYELAIPEFETYYVVVLSQAMARRKGEAIDNSNRGELNGFFTDVDALVGDRQMLLVTRDIKNDAPSPVNFTFTN